MIENSVVAEVRRAREEIAKRFNYDLRAIIDDARKRQGAGRTKGRVISSQTCRSTGCRPADKSEKVEGIL